MRARYYSCMRWTKAVADELANHGRRGTSRGSSALQTGAKRWDTEKRCLGEPFDFNGDPRVSQVQAIVKSSARKQTDSSHDLGESETILLAADESGIAIINEDAGRRVAQRYNVKSYSTMDILISAYKEGKIELSRLKASYEQLREGDLDGGELLPSNIRLKRHPWPNHAPSGKQPLRPH